MVSVSGIFVGKDKIVLSFILSSTAYTKLITSLTMYLTKCWCCDSNTFTNHFVVERYGDFEISRIVFKGTTGLRNLCKPQSRRF